LSDALVSRRIAVSLQEGETAVAMTSGDRSCAADAMTVKVPFDLFGWMKNVLLVLRLALRVWSCEDETTWRTVVPCGLS